MFDREAESVLLFKYTRRGINKKEQICLNF